MKSKKRVRRKKLSERRRRAGTAKARRADELLNTALSHHRVGELGRANQLYKQVLTIDPQSTRALHHLGLIAHQAGQPVAAIGWLERAVQVDASDAISWNFLGNLKRELGQLHPAIEAYREAVAQRPNYETALYNLAMTLQKTGDASAAITIFEDLVKLMPRDADVWNRLGAAYLDSSDPDAAKRAHEHALELDPDSAEAHNGLGLTCMDIGEFDDAAEHYRAAIKRDPAFIRVYYNLAKSHRFSSADDPDLDLIESVLQRPGLSRDERADLHFGLGKAHDDYGNYDRAFKHFEQANSLKRASMKVDKAGHQRWMDNLRETFNASFYRQREGYGNESDKPVFIVGMPRSGTTLVEQIISSHPQAHGAGELAKIGDLARTLCESVDPKLHYPGYVPQLDAATCQAAAAEYLSFVEAKAGNATRITDKLPANYLRLGLIALLFPNARVIDCRRSALDTVVSIYFSHFAGDHPFAYSLEDIEFEYQQYVQLMAHWRQVLPLSWHEVSYEALVEDTEAQTRELIAAVGLGWDPACLRFYDTERPVHTASNWQVRRPVYPRSMGRWKHYAAHLSALEHLQFE